MKSVQPFEAAITPFEEVTATQLAAFKRHKANGTSPGNPKWYRPLVVRPFKFDGRMVLPRIETGGQFMLRWREENKKLAQDPVDAVAGIEDVRTYVRQFEQAAHLKGQVDWAAMRERGILVDKVVAKRRVRQREAA